MGEWYNALSIFSKGAFILGTIMGIFLVIQLIMLIIGMETDVDVDCDVSDVDFNDASFFGMAGLKMLSVRTIVIFLCVGSWVAFTMDTNDCHMGATIPVSILSGLAVSFIFAFAMMKIMKLQGEGNIVFENSIGKPAEVYLTIPADGSRYGKVTVLVQERMIEMEAKSESNEEIKTGERVEIVDVINNIAIVRRK